MHTQPSTHTKLCPPRYTTVVTRRHRSIVALAAAGCSLLIAVVCLGKPKAPAKPPPQVSSASPKQALSPVQRAARGVVTIERQGRTVGLGVVLAGDGRMLTALSVVGDGNGVDARYADGSVVNVRVGHSDRAWDLALLVPQIGRWPEGLSASSSDPLRTGSRIRTFTLRNKRLVPASVVIKGRAELLGGDGELLRDALAMSTRVPSTDLGAPLIDEKGQVLGMVSKACEAGGKAGRSRECRAVAYGAPMAALRQFLRSAPSNAIPPSAWLGIQGVAATTPIARGVRVGMVHPESPAHRGGLRAGRGDKADVIVSVDGTPVGTPERLASLVRGRAVGDEVELIVLRNGKLKVLGVVLQPAPTTRPRHSPGRLPEGRR